MRADKKLLEQQIDNVCSLIEQVVEDKGNILKAAQNAKTVQDLSQEFENIIEQVKNINLEDDKIHEILKYFDYNQLENEIKLKLKLIRNFFLENGIIFFVLNK